MDDRPHEPRARHPFLDHDGPIPFAHRGGALDQPENTIVAFQGAIDLGYRYLETDVHATSDGVLVAFHDDDLSRTCGRPGKISELPWSEVQTARVDGKEPIPLLTDLFEAFPEARINIDCKADSGVDPLIGILRRTDSLARVCLGGFSDRRLKRLRKALGQGTVLEHGTARGGALAPRLPAVGRAVRAGSGEVRAGARSCRRARWGAPTAAASWSTCGRSTTRTRWSDSSTSASTGS